MIQLRPATPEHNSVVNAFDAVRTAAIRAAAKAMRDLTGNLAPMPGIFPDYPAPIICTGDDGVRELVMARWGMPSPAQVIFEATSARRQTARLGRQQCCSAPSAWPSPTTSETDD